MQERVRWNVFASHRRKLCSGRSSIHAACLCFFRACTASVCQDLLLQQEDYLRAVRGLLREIVRSVKHEVQFQSMALGMMAEPDLDKFEQLDALGKGTVFSLE